MTVLGFLFIAGFLLVWLVCWYVASNITEPWEWSKRRQKYWNKYHRMPWW